jgi:hypothetical protein
LWEDVKWVCIADWKKSIVLFFKKLVVRPFAQSMFLRKKMYDAQTQNLGPLMHTFGVYNKTQNLYVGSNLCDQTHPGWAIG